MFLRGKISFKCTLKEKYDKIKSAHYVMENIDQADVFVEFVNNIAGKKISLGVFKVNNAETINFLRYLASYNFKNYIIFFSSLENKEGILFALDPGARTKELKVLKNRETKDIDAAFILEFDSGTYFMKIDSQKIMMFVKTAFLSRYMFIKLLEDSKFFL